MAVRTATYNHVFGFWTEEATEAYLKEVGINSAIKSKITDFKRRVINHDHEDLKRELEQKDYDQVIPSVWRYDDICDIKENIDPIMHMVFEGIVKVMYKSVIPNALTLFKVNKECHQKIQEQLQLVRKMSVSWIRPESLTKTKLLPTGWRGVDFVAAARLMKNCISHVYDAIILKGGPHLDTTLEKFQIFEKFVCSCHSMISRIMCESCTDDSITDLEHHIKLFLSLSEKYCRLVRGKQAHETFLSLKGNFLSLLNIPDEMREFGPLRRYWDGDYEAFVKLIKEVLPGGLNRDGEKTLVSKLLRFKERTTMIIAANTSLEYLRSNNHIEETVVYERNTTVHIYKSLPEVEKIIQKNEPISAVMVEDDQGCISIVVPYKIYSKKRVHDMSESGLSEQRLNCVMLQHNINIANWKSGSWYVHHQVQNNKAYGDGDITISVLERNEIKKVVLLPNISLSNEVEATTNMYSVHSDDWTEIDEDAKFKWMSVPRL